MGWNPESQEFVPLNTPEAQTTARERNWTKFAIDEGVLLKNIAFTITEIGPRRMVLRPVIKERD